MKLWHAILSFLSPAVYRDDGGRLEVKHAFHGWEDLEQHLKSEHPELPWGIIKTDFRR